MKTFKELTPNQKINLKASLVNKYSTMGNNFDILKRTYQEYFESVDNVFDYVRTKIYFQTGGLKN